MTRGEACNWLRNLRADVGKIEHQGLWHYEQALAEIIELLEEQPSIDGVKHGRWKYISFLTVECSECKTQIHDLEYSNFCPNCGARMDGETCNNTEEKLQ